MEDDEEFKETNDQYDEMSLKICERLLQRRENCKKWCAMPKHKNCGISADPGLTGRAHSEAHASTASPVIADPTRLSPPPPALPKFKRNCLLRIQNFAGVAVSVFLEKSPLGFPPLVCLFGKISPRPPPSSPPPPLEMQGGRSTPLNV